MADPITTHVFTVQIPTDFGPDCVLSPEAIAGLDGAEAQLCWDYEINKPIGRVTLQVKDGKVLALCAIDRKEDYDCFVLATERRELFTSKFGLGGKALEIDTDVEGNRLVNDFTPYMIGCHVEGKLESDDG